MVITAWKMPVWCGYPTGYLAAERTLLQSTDIRRRQNWRKKPEALNYPSGARPAWDVSLAKQPRGVHALLWSQPQRYVHAAGFAKIPTLHSLKQQARRLAGGLLHSDTTACKAAMRQCLNLTKTRGRTPQSRDHACPSWFARGLAAPVNGTPYFGRPQPDSSINRTRNSCFTVSV